ncbi:MAG: PAS domain S-box protein [Bacteroidetes bacterium]|nr:PAS domain S-box protein [Bacteroidota bacterium]
MIIIKITKLRISRRYILIPAALLVFFFLFYRVYDDIKIRTVNEFNQEQLTLAQASSQGITSFFQNYTNDLLSLTRYHFVTDFGDDAREFYKNYYESHKNFIEAVTRVDAQGRIQYTYPNTDSLIGSDLSYQKHIKQIMETHQPVLSDVFMSVQGFLAVALHVPVFKNNEYAGSLAILVKIDKLGKEYLGNIKLRGTGASWILTENNIEIYCQEEQHPGKSYLDITDNNPAALILADKIKTESQGFLKGVHVGNFDNGKKAFDEKYIVFYRIPLNNTYWSILISYDEDDIYAAISSFRNKLVFLFFIIFLILAYYFYSLTKVSTLLREEAKRKETERILKESENRYRTLVESINDGVLHTDYSGIIRFANNSVCEMLGYSKLEMVGKLSFNDLIYHEDRKILERNIELRLKGESSKYEIRIVTKSGSIIWLSVNGTPMLDTDRKSVGSVGFFSNITEKKRAEEEIMKITQAIRQSPVALVITDKDGNVEYVNPKFESITGYTLEELKGKNPRILKSGEMTDEEYKVLWDTINSGKDWFGEFHNKKKNGDLYWENAVISPVKNSKGEITHFLAIKEDITEKKDIIKELVQAKERAEESSRLKSNFLANMSHEIRTPLNGILGFAELLKSELINEEQRSNVQVILASGKRLLDTLNMILSFSKLEAEKSSAYLNDLRVCSVIEEAVKNFEAMARNKGLYLETVLKHPELTAKLDDRLLRNILNNLLKNAIVFTDNGGVTVHFDCSGDTMTIKVADTGVGIEKENFDMIFEPFRQESEGFGRNFEGTGLGLSITKRYVEMLKGRISVESEKDKGSVFTVELPLHPAITPVDETVITDSEPEAVNIAGKQSSRKRSVLIVENDKENLAYAETVLRRLFKTDSAVDGFIAVEKARRDYYDIILMDINLGHGIDGIQAAKEIRKLGGYSDTPIVAVTAYAQEGDREEFLSSGCSHYIAKPFSREELLTLMEEISSSI